MMRRPGGEAAERHGHQALLTVLGPAPADHGSQQAQAAAPGDLRRQLQAQLAARRDRLVGQEPASGEGQVDQHAGPAPPAGAEPDRGSDSDAALTAPLGPVVEQVKQQKAKRLGMEGATHDVLDVRPAQGGPQGTGVGVEHRHPQRLTPGQPLLEVQQALGRPDHQVPGPAQVAARRSAQALGPVELQVVEQGAHVGELAVVQKQDPGSVGRGLQAWKPPGGAPVLIGRRSWALEGPVPAGLPGCSSRAAAGA
jgi:hypothetical protein